MVDGASAPPKQPKRMQRDAAMLPVPTCAALFRALLRPDEQRAVRKRLARGSSALRLRALRVTCAAETLPYDPGADEPYWSPTRALHFLCVLDADSLIGIYECRSRQGGQHVACHRLSDAAVKRLVRTWEVPLPAYAPWTPCAPDDADGASLPSGVELARARSVGHELLPAA